jgi:hypothetical protein
MAIQKQPACCRRVTVGTHEQLIIETTAGQRITLMDGPVCILIEDTSGNSIRLENGKVTVSTPGKLELQAAELEINSSQVVMNAAMLRCSGEHCLCRQLHPRRRECVVAADDEAMAPDTSGSRPSFGR